MTLVQPGNRQNLFFLTIESAATAAAVRDVATEASVVHIIAVAVAVAVVGSPWAEL
jgi:hypothetical protein